MKILYLLEQFPKKTSETFILSEMIALQKMGHDVWVLTDWVNYVDAGDTHALVRENNFMAKVIAVDLYSRGALKIVDFIKKVSCDLVAHPAITSRNLRAAIFPLSGRGNKNIWTKLDNYFILRKISGLRFSLIYSPFAPIEKIRRGLMLSRAYRAPFVAAFRALELYSYKYENNIRENKALFDSVHSFVTISEANKKHLAADLGFKQSIAVIHSLIDPDRFVPPAVKVENPHLRIITVARFIEKKGIEYLLEALASLRQSGLSFTYTLIGDGPLRVSYEAKISALGLSDNVVILAPMNQEKIRSFLEDADILVLPCVIASDGDRDILANVLKEAMAMELPVVTSNISGIKELIKDEESGLLVPERDAAALAAAIAKLAADPDLRQHLGRCGRQKIISDFNVNREIGKINQVFAAAAARYALDHPGQTDLSDDNPTIRSAENYFSDILVPAKTGKPQAALLHNIVNKCNAMMPLLVYERIYQTAYRAQAGDMLELGAAYGGATISLARAIIDSQKKSRLFAVESGGGVGSSLAKLGPQDFNLARLRENINYFSCHSVVTVIPEKIDAAEKYLIEAQPFSLLMIDADGKIDRDFLLFYNRLRSGADIIIDDYRAESRPDQGTAANPRGKGWSTYLFVNYFLRLGLIKKKSLVGDTIFCQKPKKITGPVKFNEEELASIRASMKAG